jgi:hypothetical protein
MGALLMIQRVPFALIRECRWAVLSLDNIGCAEGITGRAKNYSELMPLEGKTTIRFTGL